MNKPKRPLAPVKSSGNVFEDLGFPSAEAANLLARSTVMIDIVGRVAALRRPQRQVALLLGISQPRLNNLLKNKLDKFSLDALVNILAKLGGSITVAAPRIGAINPTSSERQLEPARANHIGGEQRFFAVIPAGNSSSSAQKIRIHRPTVTGSHGNPLVHFHTPPTLDSGFWAPRTIQRAFQSNGTYSKEAI